MDNMLVERFRVRILGVFEGGRAVGATRQDKGDAGLPVKPGIVYSGIAQTGATSSGRARDQ